MQLRPYQSSAVDATWEYLRTTASNPLIVLPTGAGKTLVIAELCRAAVQDWNGRVMVLAHVRELLAQGMDKLQVYAPELEVGAYSAGLGKRDRFAQVIFAGIQSVAKKAHSFPPPDLLLIDEAHRVGLKDDGIYRNFITDLKRYNPRLRVIGLSATPYRLQGQATPVCGAEYVFQDICYEANVADLIRDGYLCPLTSRAGVSPDLSSVHVRGGEYIEKELAAAFMPLVNRTVEDMLERTEGRRAGVLFCVNVEHATAVRDALTERGESAAMVSGKTKKKERDAIIADFNAGKYRWIVNVNVLTEGFDAPHIDVVAMLRATKSAGLYVQMIGRGLRLADGKANCLVLDYSGNTLTHGPIDQIKVRKKHGTFGQEEVVVGRSKQCPECEALMANGVRECAECGYVFSMGSVDHYDQAIEAPILSSDMPRVVRTASVQKVSYKLHESKKSGTPTMKVTYQLGLRSVSEWVCFEHAGFARSKAVAWWTRMGGVNVPATVEQALLRSHELSKPARIIFDDTERYPEVKGYEFDDSQGKGGNGGNDREVSVGVAESGSPNPLPGMRGLPQWMVSALGGGN